MKLIFPKMYEFINNTTSYIVLLMDQLRILIPHFTHERYLWFYCRKALFQVMMPILLTLLSISNFVSNSNQKHDSASSHLYFYTSAILFLYVSMTYILKYIFSIFSEKLILRKEINLMNTTNNLILEADISSNVDELSFIVSKRVFKARYSQSPFFQKINKLCWFLGIDSPILIPQEILFKLSNSKIITADNEHTVMKETLLNLCTYHPTMYNHNHISEDSQDSGKIENLVSSCIITHLDRTIAEIQLDLFDKRIDGRSNHLDV